MLVVSSSDSSRKLIKAKRLFFTLPPSIENLKPLNLSPSEKATLNTSIYYYAPAADTTNYLGIRDWLWTLSLTSAPGVPADEDLFEVLFATNYSISEADARKTITEAVQSLIASGTLPSNSKNDCNVDFVAFNNHNSILWRQSVSELRSGVVQDVLALQGPCSTWYTGSLWGEDYTGNVWAFTETVLPRLLASFGREMPTYEVS